MHIKTKHFNMTEGKSTKELGAIYVINNPESVVEVYLDLDKMEVRELKCLNYNRCKEYIYTVAEYIERFGHHKAGQVVINEIKKCL